MIQRIDETKRQLFKMKNKIDSPLVRLMKKKEWIQIRKII